MQFREKTLENGLQIIAECNPAAYSTALAFFVNTGSRDETDDVAGVSHFLEHMVFKGTKKRSAADVNRELDEIGSNSNAYTSEEQTVYYATVLPELQGRALELLSDIMRPALRVDDFEMEKQVILEEIAKYEDQPPFGAHEKCMAAHFGKHPLGNSILGTVDSVSRLTADQMRAYFDRRYSPGNLVLAAAGNVDFDQLVSDMQNLCGNWKPYEVERDCSAGTPLLGCEVVEKTSAAQEYVVQIARSPAAEDERRFATRLLTTIVGDDSGSRLFWELIDTGLAEYASMGPYEFQGVGITMTFLCCEPGDAEENVARIQAVEQEVAAGGVIDDELVRAKSKICSHVILQSERPTSRLFSIGQNWIQRRTYRTVRETVNRYQQVTADEIAACQQAFPLLDSTTVAVGPLGELKLG